MMDPKEVYLYRCIYCKIVKAFGTLFKDNEVLPDKNDVVFCPVCRLDTRHQYITEYKG